jgi:DNA topoisomerase-1
MAASSKKPTVKKPTRASKGDKALVIVESPAKARTIAKYLGPDFIVESSIGHIRDLPSTAAEIPAEYKGESWSRLGVNVDEDFKPLYIVPNSKKAQVKKLQDQLKKARELYLATDEDREGEAIAWHLSQVLKAKCPIKRMVFDEITKATITKAVHETREIDQRLVNAQETRRILDRLYGYEVSPVLWRKVKPKLSAGRVQSVATRLVVDRERARIKFVQAEYYDVGAKLETRTKPGETVETRLVELDGRRVALGKDFDEDTGKLKEGKDVVLLNGDDARAIVATLATAEFVVASVDETPFTNRPHAPFITSTLQQEAARKLRFSAQRTMRVAQNLYENGYITYMRTDSTSLSNQAVNAARSQVTELYGEDYLPDAPRVYKSKSKNAQEAHEAIRPAGESFRTPKSIEKELDVDAKRLYELIWKRTVASQMNDAKGMRTSVRIHAPAGDRGTASFATSGKVIHFPGYLRAYVEGSDDPEADLEDQETILPPLATGETLDPVQIDPLEHTTQPPSRYTEASLIRELEERGIGRPSTYAAIIQTIQDRGYVWNKGTALVPSFTAFGVIQLLEQHLTDLVDYDFTAKMENGLDAIANGERQSGPWLHDFYFGEPNGKQNGDHVADIGLKALIGATGETIDARTISRVRIGQTDDGEEVAVRVGRYGPYVQIGDSDQRASVPDDIPPDEFTLEKAVELIEQAAQGDKVLGQDPETGKPVYIKTGRFGPYVQLGDPERTEKGKVKRGTKPKRGSLWPTMTMETITFEQAMMLLSFPREVGPHPETGTMITAQDGRFGPYITMGEETRSLPDHEKLASLTVAEAVELFKQPKRGRGRTTASVMAELGTHPDNEATVQVKNGRYGPYVTDGVVNATIPKGKDPSSVTLSEAVEWISAREQKLRDQGKDPRAPKKKRAASARKTTKKKKQKKSTNAKSGAPAA